MVRKGKWKIRLRSVVSLRWEKRRPRLVVHEKYEKAVRWSVWTLTGIGVLSSVVVFAKWYAALAFAVLLLAVTVLLQKAVFQFTSIYVQPLPDFEYDPAQWKAMAFAVLPVPKEDMLNVVGCAFASPEYADRFFSLLKAWNYGQPEDRDNNICLSFIVESDSQYSVYIYPNPRRESVNEFFDAAGEEQQQRKPGKRHQELVMQMVFCKRFPYSKESSLNMFLGRQPRSRPFWLKPFIVDQDGQTRMAEGIAPILKWHYKFKRRQEVEKGELEFEVGV